MKIKFLVMDVDGTLTDGKIYMGPDGEVMKAFNAKDGAGIHDLAIPAGIVPVVITGRNSRIVENRCKELEILELHQGVRKKEQKLAEILERFSKKTGTSCQMNQVAYIGDDINDFSVMNAVKAAGGKTGCPADAIDEIRSMADFVSRKAGGDGAVREFIEWLMAEERNRV